MTTFHASVVTALAAHRIPATVTDTGGRCMALLVETTHADYLITDENGGLPTGTESVLVGQYVADHQNNGDYDGGPVRAHDVGQVGPRMVADFVAALVNDADCIAAGVLPGDVANYLSTALDIFDDVTNYADGGEEEPPFASHRFTIRARALDVIATLTDPDRPFRS